MHFRSAFFVLWVASLAGLAAAGFARSASAQAADAATGAPPSPPPPSTGDYTSPSTPGYTDGGAPQPANPAPPASAAPLPVDAPPPQVVAPPPVSAAPPAPVPPPPPYWALQPAVYAPPALPPTPTLRDHRYTDAHVDRVILAPTAETHPEGTFYVSSYELVVLQVGYAVTDRTQITLTSMPPLPNEKILPFDLSLKTVVASAPKLRVAALASVSGISGIEQGTVVVARLGGVVQLCFEVTCRSSVSVGSDAVLAGEAIITSGIGFIVHASTHVSVLFELDSVVPVGLDVATYGGLTASPGVRFSGRHLALDLAFIRAVGVSGPAIPFLAMTYRTGD